MQFCETSDSGKQFLDIYTANGMSKNAAELRKLLKIAVVEHFYRLGRGHINQHTFREMVQMICNEISTEDPSVWYSASTCNTNSAGGLLYSRYRYLQQHDIRFRNDKNITPTVSRKRMVAEKAGKDWTDLEKSEQNKCIGN